MTDNVKQHSRATNLDSFDIKILSELGCNANVTAVELSEKVHLSRTAVVRRIKNLQKSGIIDGTRTLANYEKLGFSIRAFVLVKAVSRVSHELRIRLLERPEVLSASAIVGDGLLMLDVIAIDSNHLHRFLAWLQDYGDSETSLVLRKHDSTIGLRERIDQVQQFLAMPDDRFK